MSMMSNEQEKLLRKISSAQFAAWELHIFLDTHPDDDEAIKSYKKYNDIAAVLINEYEKKFGPLKAGSVTSSSMWKWVNEPWPWEKEGN